METPGGLSSTLNKLPDEPRNDQEIFAQRISSFNDEIAKKISWTPLASGGANFPLNCIKEDKEGNYYVTGTWIYSIFSLIPFFVGIGILYVQFIRKFFPSMESGILKNIWVFFL